MDSELANRRQPTPASYRRGVAGDEVRLPLAPIPLRTESPSSRDGMRGGEKRHT
jgi:hypothetical protein